MTTVIAGTDTYGRVKSVQHTPIITQFTMLQMFPLWPIKSMYYFGKGQEGFQGIPLIAFETKTELRGLELARIDSASVVMAYIRAVLGTIGILAGIACMMLILMGSPKDAPDWLDPVIYVTTGVAICLGGLSYLVPLTSSRERTIRSHCAEVLGVAIDPAKITPKAAKQINDFLPGIWKQFQADLSDQVELSRLKLICKLIQARCNIRGKVSPQRESDTDHVLVKLQEFS